jgi:putrescine transport system substrate-binding protein
LRFHTAWVESGQGIAKSSNCLSYPNANKDATELVDKKIRDNSGFHPSKQTLDTLLPLEPLPLKPS